jgi:tetratricopeptide (TPR) repeat protein
MKRFLLPLLPILLLISSYTFSQGIETAKQLLYYERYSSAESMLHQIIAGDPGNAESWYLLTEACLKQNKTKNIEDSLTLAPAQIKDEPFFQVAEAYLLLYQNFPEKAEPLIAAALQKTKEKNPSILLAAAKSEADAEYGDANKAVDLLNKAIRKDKHNAELYTALGNAFRKLKNGTEAYKAYQSALAEDAGYAEALCRMGMIFISQKNHEMYLKYFNDAVEADPMYAPALYQLYFHYYFKNVHTAMDYLKRYMAVSDHKLQTDYDYTDLLYLTGKYDAAVQQAKQLISGNQVPPRLYKLVAYSYKEMGKTDDGFAYMKKYFSEAPDSIEIVKDFATMADLYSSKGLPDSATYFYQKAVAMEKDSAELVSYYKKLATIFKDEKKYADEAYWYGKYYALNHNATNVELFNWGIAHYLSGEYLRSDSVFAVYTEKYPAQDFGYYWRARSNAAIDTTMEQGLAVPHYTKVIEIDEADTANAVNRKHLIEAYGYLAAYKANQEKDYEMAIDYFEKLLALDPNNSNARKYMDMLKKDLAQKETTTG